MGIYIKDMEMPDGCFLCILSFMYFNGTENVLRCNALKKLVSDDGSKDPDCPLIETTSHGRLIDVDELYLSLIRIADEDWNKRCGGSWSDGLIESAEIAKNAPTVIPADKDDET